MDRDDQRNRDLERIKEAVRVLSEHFDTIQVFATRYEGDDDGNTVSWCQGSGNWYARFGLVTEWVEKKREGARIDERKDNE